MAPEWTEYGSVDSLHDLRITFDRAVFYLDDLSGTPAQCFGAAAKKLLTITPEEYDLPNDQIFNNLVTLVGYLREDRWVSDPALGTTSIRRLHASLTSFDDQRLGFRR
jgi:hypothetical protein